MAEGAGAGAGAGARARAGAGAKLLSKAGAGTRAMIDLCSPSQREVLFASSSWEIAC